MLPLALGQSTTLLTSRRPGPVNLDVPYNLFQEEDDVELPPSASQGISKRSGAAPEDILKVADLLMTAKSH